MRVVVVAGARLHAGFYTVDGPWNVLWGGSGFYVEEPRVEVEAWSCGEPRLEGYSGYEDIARLLVDRLKPSQTCLKLGKALPRHVGLGSTTQVALASGVAVSVVEGLGLSVPRLASILGRGRYSLVGTLLFIHGGFVVDPGVPSGAARALSRLDVPGDWRFIIVIPRVGRGFSEGEEARVMEARRPSQASEYMMAKGTIMLASAVARGDLDDALEALRLVQSGTGLYFSGIQGGVYRGDVSRIVEEASRDGIVLAQSSWGPTLYTIAHEDEAASDARLIKLILGEAGIPGEVLVSRPRNTGAEVRRVA
ncbi:MAG: hypothetical protein GSR86_00445 [Desulfurococcales archaeon]|nr:hypothetical protein [Desulfurococcales archaeon]